MGGKTASSMAANAEVAWSSGKNSGAGPGRPSNSGDKMTRQVSRRLCTARCPGMLLSYYTVPSDSVQIETVQPGSEFSLHSTQ